jgi:transglutaminase-like putative cysteine protease
MPRLTVFHETLYRYSQPVRFGEHRLMFRPRDSHDLRLVDTALVISPPAQVHWLHDVFSNSIAIARFHTEAQELRFESRIEIDHYGQADPDFPLEPYAQHYPFSYASEEVADLGRTIERNYPDPDRQVDLWARAVVGSGGPVETQALLSRMTRQISLDITYEQRFTVGVQTPAETLALGRGTCRDLALLMMEACRSLGFAARFVSGYLHDPSLDLQGGGAGDGMGTAVPALQVDNAADRPSSAVRGAGDTHAWVQIYLPGAGWVEFDPTNGLVGGANLIRVAVARDPAQAIPLQGSYYGPPEAFLDMAVEVKVSAVER